MQGQQVLEVEENLETTVSSAPTRRQRTTERLATPVPSVKRRLMRQRAASHSGPASAAAPPALVCSTSMLRLASSSRHGTPSVTSACQAFHLLSEAGVC